MDNFIGKDNFVWWVGVVEKRDDPLGIGRCKVRIFGWHTDNLEELPTEALPWATPVNSPNNSKKFEAPREGEYVVGFFGDGRSAQMPIMTGVFAAIQSTEPDTNKGFSPQNDAEVGPQLPEGVEANQVGQPNTPPLARGVVEKTGVDKTNKETAHVCDITGPLRYNIAVVSTKIKEVLQLIRTTIQSLWASVSSSPFADEVRNKIKTIKGKIEVLNKIAKDISEKIAVVREVIEKLQKLIQDIANLPTKLAEKLRECLDQATASLRDAIVNSKSIVSSSAVADIQKSIKSTTSELSNVTVSESPETVSFSSP
jgi:hypothetical protein